MFLLWSTYRNTRTVDARYTLIREGAGESTRGLDEGGVRLASELS
jgi:hypothetical protein